MLPQWPPLVGLNSYGITCVCKDTLHIKAGLVWNSERFLFCSTSHNQQYYLQNKKLRYISQKFLSPHDANVFTFPFYITRNGISEVFLWLLCWVCHSRIFSVCSSSTDLTHQTFKCPENKLCLFFSVSEACHKKFNINIKRL